MTNLVKRLVYNEQKDWFNKNNWSIFQSALVSKGATTYSYPSSANSGIEEKLSFLGEKNQINHFNENPNEIANNIIVSRNGPQWEKVGDVISGSVAPSSRRNVASSADGSVIAMKIGNYDMFYSGPVRIYKFTNGLWKQKGGDITPQNDGLVMPPSLQFMSTSLSYDGSVVAIGSVRPSDDSNKSYRGTVNVYKFDDNSSSWVNRGAVINGERKQDYSGWSTSLSADGSRLAIGAYKNDDSGDNSGHVRVYKYNSSSWEQIGEDIAGEIEGAQSGYSVSLSADGSVVAIGAIYNTNNQEDITGHVRVYEYDGAFGSGWNQRGGNIDGEGAWDGSGNSVSLSADGSVVAIGASMIFNLSDRNLDTGHVRVYRYNPEKNAPQITNQDLSNYGPAGWDRIGKDIDGEGENDFSGYSVSLSHDGSVVAIGSLKNNIRVYHYRKYTEDDDKNGVSKFNYASRIVNTNQTKPVIITSEFETITKTKPLVGNFYWTQVGLDINQSGKQVSLSDDGTIVAIGTRVYQIAKRNLWVQQGLDIDGESAGDESGSSTSLSADGSLLAIGSYMANGTTGNVRVYRNESGLWKQVGSNIEGGQSGEYSGGAISLTKNGSVLAISADGYNDYTGKVRVFENSNNSWTQLGEDINGEAIQDQSGWSVSCVDGRDENKPLLLAIGAVGNDDNGLGSGHVRVYEYRVYTADDIDENGISKFNHQSTLLNTNQKKPLIITSGFDTSPQVGSSYWIQVGKDIDGEGADDRTGESVSFSSDGTTLAIGATGNDNDNGFNSGHVSVYRFDNETNNWKKFGDDIDGETVSDASGVSVSLNSDGTILAIAATLNDGNGTNSGHVRVYKNISGSWEQIGSDIDGEASDDLSGEDCDNNNKTFYISYAGSTLINGVDFEGPSEVVFDSSGTQTFDIKIFDSTIKYDGLLYVKIEDIEGECQNYIEIHKIKECLPVDGPPEYPPTINPSVCRNRFFWDKSTCEDDFEFQEEPRYEDGRKCYEHFPRYNQCYDFFNE